MFKSLLKAAMPTVLAALLASFTGTVIAQDGTGEISYVEMVLGNEVASVTVTEYASLTCPHCATFHRDVYPELKRNYIDTGKIRFIIREIYFDRPGLIASLVARCGGEEKFFDLVDRILATQREWSQSDSLRTVALRLRSIAMSMGISEDQFNACIRDTDKAEFLIDTSRQLASKDGVNSTPSFVINGKTHSNMSYDEMARLIEDAIAE